MTSENEPAQAQQQPPCGIRWNDYRNDTPDEAAEAIYANICATATEFINWYWHAIQRKKKSALWIRTIAFAMLILGAVAQIFTGAIELPERRLYFTQGSLALLAVGALLLQGDRSFGWTSGWTRYISAAMTMETLFRDFKLKWARYQVARTAALTTEDLATLFDLASTLEAQLIKTRSEETAAWATEFHAGLQLLESAIKFQRENTEKKLDELQASVDKKDAEGRNAEKPGAIELALKFKEGPRRVRITLDKGTPEEVLSSSWARMPVAPGQHGVEITVLGDPPLVVSKIVDVASGATSRVEVQIEA